MTSNSKVIVITGASRGIGLCVVQEILSRPEKHRVVAVARSAPPLRELAEQYPSRVAILIGDLSDSLLGPQVIDLAISRFHQVDGVVVNHAIIEPVQRVADASIVDWRKAYDVNFFSAVAIVKAAIPPLRATRGTIILVSSGASITPYLSLGAYGSSKAALNNLAALIRNEENDITAIAVGPGRVDTQMHTLLREKYSKTMPPEDSAVFFRLKERGELLPPDLPGCFVAQLALETPASLNGRFTSYGAEEMSVAAPAGRSAM